MAVILTKKSMAKRIYATVLNAGNNTDGYKEQGTIQIKILNQYKIVFIQSSQASGYCNGGL